MQLNIFIIYVINKILRFITSITILDQITDSSSRVHQLIVSIMTKVYNTTCEKREACTSVLMNEDAHSALFDPVRNRHQVTHQFICVHKTGLFWATRLFFLRILAALPTIVAKFAVLLIKLSVTVSVVLLSGTRR